MKVGVLFGGPSTEHDVSVVSGQGIVKNLDLAKYEVYPIYLSKNLEWFIGKEPIEKESQAQFSWENYSSEFNLKGEFGPGRSSFPDFEIVFNGSGECATIDWSFLSLSMPAWVIICSLFLIAYAIWINYGPE